MALSFPRDPVVELFLDGWRDVSADVRQSPAITITQGRKDESARLSPCRCTLTLDDGEDHGNGDYDPHNPLGQWFGTIGRNTPLRVSLGYGADDFTRTEASGWGTSPDMGAWSSFQSAGTVASSVASGLGQHSITSTTAFIGQYLDDVDVKDVDVYVETSFASNIVVTGGPLEPANVMLRGQDTTTYYMLRLTLTTSQTLTAALLVGSSQTLFGPVSVAAQWTDRSQPLSVRFQADGNTFRGKAWTGGTAAEPIDWDLEYSHGDVYGAGWVGVRSGVASGNSNTKPVVFRYDNYTVRLPRFAGETSRFQPVRDLDDANFRTEVEASGVLRRLSQGVNPLHSPIYRYLTTTSDVTLVDYWTLEDSPDADPVGVSALTGGTTAVFTQDVSDPLQPKGTIQWRGAPELPSIVGAPLISSGGLLTLHVRTGVISTQWSASWVQEVSADGGAGTWLRVGTAASQVGDIVYFWYTDGSYEIWRVASPSDVLLFTGTLPVPTAGTNGVWHTVQFSAVDNGGGSVTYLSSIDGETPQLNIETATYGALTRFETNVDVNTNWSGAWSHVAVFLQRIDNGTPDLALTVHDAYLGWIGETAGDRFERLCAEEDVPSSMVGYPTVTPFMGPQRPDTLLTLLRECVDVDQGSMYESRGSAALGMRTNRSTMAQDPVLILDYASSEVAERFAATTDDQATLNDVTASRPLGGEYRVERSTGPLNTQNPGTDVDAVGRYDTSVDVNVQTDLQLPSQTGWRVHLGTTVEPRFPVVAVDLAAPDLRSQLDLTCEVLDVTVDDGITVTNADAARIYDDVRQLARGYTETLDTAYQHRIAFNTTPASPYDVGAFDDADARWSPQTSATATTVSSSATSFTVSVTAGQLWTTAAGAFPLDVVIGGERIRLSAISGTSSPQTFTVDTGGRAVNGVVKAHVAGESVALFRPSYYGV